MFDELKVNRGGNVGEGLAMGAVAVIVAWFVGLWIASSIGEQTAIVGGAMQLLWAVPAALHFRRTERPQTANGVIIVVSCAFLLDVWCVAGS